MVGSAGVMVHRTAERLREMARMVQWDGRLEVGTWLRELPVGGGERRR